MTQLARDERLTACLLGGALGDAMGAYFEGCPPDDKAGRLPAELRVTDDTQLTVATCQSIVEAGAVDPAAVAEHFVRWFRDRRITGIGASTLKALSELDAGGHWALVGATGERSAGNGAAMRVAPLAFFLDPDVDHQRQIIRDVCRITHRNDEAYLGALALLRAIRHVVAGHPLDARVLTVVLEALPDSRVRDRLSQVREASWSIGEYARRFSTSGYVVDSVPLALLAAVNATDLLDTIQQIVQCGGDTDTIASMFGQLYGAACGPSVLPREMVDRIDAVALVRETAARCARVASADS